MIRSILKAVLPRRFVQLLRDLGHLESGARVTFLRLACLRLLGVVRPRTIPSGPTMTLVAICHGNILRSAYAEALLKRPDVAARLPGLRVSSAGVHALPGKSADPRGVKIAREQGVDLGGHRATQLDARIVEAADLLVVMDFLNEAEVVSRYPAAARKVTLLGGFDPGRPRNPAVPDPFSGDLDAVRASFLRVANATEGLVRVLTSV
jgi:protein-tyrosine phosphatase